MGRIAVPSRLRSGTGSRLFRLDVDAITVLSFLVYPSSTHEEHEMTIKQVETEMAKSESGEDGIRVETVIVTERNIAQQIVREVEIQRTFDDGRERQTTVREVAFDTLTSEAHELRAVEPSRARRYVAEAVERGLLEKTVGDAVCEMYPHGRYVPASEREGGKG